MNRYVLASALLLAAISADAHSIKSAYCTADSPYGQPRFNILVQPDGSIVSTGGAAAIPFTARPKPDGTVDFFRPDGTISYEGVTMSGGYLLGTYHQPADRGGAVVRVRIPCTLR